MALREQFGKLFKEGDVIASGGDPKRKRAAKLKITGLGADSISFQSVTSQKPKKGEVDYSTLQLLLDRFCDIDPRSIQGSLNNVLKSANIRLDHTTETYLYGLVKAFRERAGAYEVPVRVGSEESALPSTTQGFMLSPALRREIEKRAVKLAVRHFEGLGYAVELRGKPFDLLCKKGVESLYVEVKGTQGPGAEILLTRGEVRFHRANAGKTALFVVSGIQVSPSGQASGGKCKVKMPWTIQEESLSPYAFVYRV